MNLFRRVTLNTYAGLLPLLLWAIFNMNAQAATLYIDPDEASIYRGDTVSLSVRLDVEENECINVIDASITYGDAVRAVDVSRGNSILSVWVEDPVINETDGTITFAGGVPNGYCGRIQGDPRVTNVVAELIFRAPGFSIGRSNDKTSDITFNDTTRVLLNDGTGNDAPLTTQGSRISLFDGAGAEIDDEWSSRVSADTDPPDEFSIELTRQEGVFSNKYFITFNTTDKQSGMDHYEVIEEPLEDVSLFRWGSLQAPWVVAKSPYVLQDQNLQSAIRVKAVDKSGNERVVTLIPDESLRTSQYLVFISLLAAGVLVLLVVFWSVLRYVRKRKREVK